MYLVVGIDGGEPSIVNDTDNLNTFDRIRSEGTLTELESTVPPITSPAWRSYSTGKTPGRLDRYGWETFNRDSKKFTPSREVEFRSLNYWDVLAAHGYRCGVVNMPTTFPPHTNSDDVFIVGGKPATNSDTFCSSNELNEQLLESIPDYQIDSDCTAGEVSAATYGDAVCKLVKQRFDAARWLFQNKGCEFVHTTIFKIDTLQHYYWNDKAEIKRVYQAIDREISAMLTEFNIDGLFLLSDHGFTGLRGTFKPNQWLANRGDVEFTTFGKMIWFLRTPLVAKMYKLLAPRRLSKYIDSISLPNNSPINWNKTRAIANVHGVIYLNRDAFKEEDEQHRFREDLLDDLQSLRLSDGTPIVENIYRGENYYTEATDPPELVVEFEKGIDAADYTLGGAAFNDPGKLESWQAVHDTHGLFGAWGDGIDSTDKTLSIIDIAPTILHHLNVPIPSDMDGEPRLDLFSGESAARTPEEGKPTAISDWDSDSLSNGRSQDVDNTLRDLGYIS